MNIESAIKRKDSTTDCTQHDLDDDDETEPKEVPEQEAEKLPNKNGLIKKLSQNGGQMGNGNSVISKESLTLVPDNTITSNMTQSNGKESPIMQNNNDEVRNCADGGTK